MKKVLLTLSLAITLGLCANAQQKSDSFFSYSDVDNNQNRTSGTIVPSLPGQGQGTDQSGAPLGSGLLLLAGMGAAYALRRKNN